MTTLLRFKDLKARNIVRSWPMVAKLIRNNEFPPGRRLASSRVWTEQEIDDWLAALPEAKTDPSKLRGWAAQRAAGKKQREAEVTGAEGA